MIIASRYSIKQDLLAYGEVELAQRIETASDEELNEIGRLAMRPIGKGNLLSRHITLGAIQFFEGAMREPKRSRRDMSVYKTEEPEPKENLTARFLKSFEK